MHEIFLKNEAAPTVLHLNSNMQPRPSTSIRVVQLPTMGWNAILRRIADPTAACSGILQVAWGIGGVATRSNAEVVFAAPRTALTV